MLIINFKSMHKNTKAALPHTIKGVGSAACYSDFVESTLSQDDKVK